MNYLITAIFPRTLRKIVHSVSLCQVWEHFLPKGERSLGGGARGDVVLHRGPRGHIVRGIRAYYPPGSVHRCPGTSHSTLHRPCVCVFDDGCMFHRIYFERWLLVVAQTLNVAMVLRSVVFTLNDDRSSPF